MIEPDSPSLIIVLVILLMLYAFFAAAKEAIAFMRISRRLQLVEEGDSAAKKIDRLAKHPAYLLATEQLILKILGFLIVTIAIFTFSPLLASTILVNNFVSALIVAIIAALVTLIFGELLPRTLARIYAEPFALRLVYFLTPVSYVALPFARLAAKVEQILGQRLEGDHGYYGLGVITEDDLRTYVDASEEGGALKEDEKDMIHSIFSLDDTWAREIMVPRIDVIAVEANTSVMESLDIILKAGHSRLPVYVNNIDNIVGILYAKDLLAHWRNGGEARPVYGLEREVYYVPESKPVSDLLRELQAKKLQIAIVVDEYGGMAGLVTIEDILEEIVGEIQDEYDSEEFFMERISDDEFIFSARMDLDDINEELSIKLPTDDSDTLGGLIYSMLGRVPEIGDSVEFDDLRLTVLSIDGHRIKTVKIQRLEDSNGDEQEDKTAVVSKKATKLIRNPDNAIAGSS